MLLKAKEKNCDPIKWMIKDDCAARQLKGSLKPKSLRTDARIIETRSLYCFSNYCQHNMDKYLSKKW